MKMRSIRYLVLLALSLGLVMATAAPAPAAIGSTTYVIVGGAQEPAKSYTFNAWPDQRTCQRPYSRVNIYIRWYISKVETNRAYITKIYMSVKPNRDTTWNFQELQDPDYNTVAYWWIDQPMLAGRTYTRTFTVGMWVPITKNYPAQMIGGWAPRSYPGEAAWCYGFDKSYDYLLRK